MKGSAFVAATVALGERLLLLPGRGPPFFHRTLGGFVCGPPGKAGLRWFIPLKTSNVRPDAISRRCESVT